MGTHDRPTHGGYPAARAEGLTELPRVPASPAPGAPRREIPIEVKPAEFMPADTVLIVQPGDTLIMRYARPMDLATADRVKQHVHRLLPQLAEVVVMSGVEQLAVYRPCPTCGGPKRETVDMVCPTCGTDYAPKARRVVD